MIRSPSSASATNNARSRSGGMIKASTVSRAHASANAGRPYSLVLLVETLEEMLSESGAGSQNLHS